MYGSGHGGGQQFEGPLNKRAGNTSGEAWDDFEGQLEVHEQLNADMLFSLEI